MRLVFMDMTLKQSSIYLCERVQICCTQKIVTVKTVIFFSIVASFIMSLLQLVLLSSEGSEAYEVNTQATL